MEGGGRGREGGWKEDRTRIEDKVDDGVKKFTAQGSLNTQRKQLHNFHPLDSKATCGCFLGSW